MALTFGMVLRQLLLPHFDYYILISLLIFLFPCPLPGATLKSSALVGELGRNFSVINDEPRAPLVRSPVHFGHEGENDIDERDSKAI